MNNYPHWDDLSPADQAQQQIELRAYVEALLRRLVQQYNERRGPDGGPISMRKVRALSRHIKAEYGL